MRHAATVLAAVALTALPGCLVTSSSATSYTGARVEPSQVGAIVLHRTTPEEAIAALGEPTERTEVYVAYDEEAVYFGARLYDTALRNQTP